MQTLWQLARQVEKTKGSKLPMTASPVGTESKSGKETRLKKYPEKLLKTQNYGLPMFNRKCVFILKSRLKLFTSINTSKFKRAKNIVNSVW